MIRAATQLLARYSHVNWALADQTMVSGTNFLTGILLARFLGIEAFGRFTLAWMAILFVNSLQHAMIIAPMMSIGPKQAEGGRPVYYGALLAQQSAFSAMSFVLLFTGVHLSGTIFPEWRVETLALPLAVAAFTFQFQDFLRRYFFTHLRGAAAFLCDAVRYIGQIALLAALFGFAPGHMDVALALWVTALTAGAAAAGSWFFIERPQWSKSAFRSTLRRHWRFSKWLTASALLQWASGNLFLVAAGTLLGASAVGALKAVQNLMGITHILFMGLENVAPVRAASQLRQGGVAAMSSYLRRISLAGSAAVALFGLVMSAAPGMWLALIYGDAYATHGDLVWWYAAIYLLAFLSVPPRYGLRALEYARPIFLSYVASSAFALVFSYPLVQWAGLAGAAGGMVVTQAITFIILWAALRARMSG